ncbi:MAG: hypothetical protein BGO14_06675 [Chlamydiales bacterium 38-26]|nr:hypothetical protein [Chlamydiales bacterium]OJV08561.1 MAG: hypothetical protein BGO14_06675 [Chlamydiales bacterium 38-26]
MSLHKPIPLILNYLLIISRVISKVMENLLARSIRYNSIGWLGLMILFCGCNSFKIDRERYLKAYQAGRLAQSEELLNLAIEHSLPENAYTSSKDSVMLLLDRATLHFVAGNIDEAIQDYQIALEAMDYYNQNSPSEKILQFILEDGVGAYPGEDFEQILARVYFALALFQREDYNNAFALLRQAEEVQQKKKELYKNDPLTKDFRLVENPVAKYLMAALLENQKDFSNAEILYKQTEQLIGNTLQNLLLNKQENGEDLATVILVAHNGNSPYKISSTTYGAAASPLALEMLLGAHGIPPAYSSMAGIPIPILMQQIHSHRVPIWTRLSRKERPLIPLYNVTAMAAHQLQQKMPLIVAEGLARLIMRRGVVAYFQEKDPQLGALADFGATIANACTQADTRSWGTLPSSIDLARFDVCPGDHTLHLHVNWGITHPFIGEFPLKLKSGDLCVINIFNIHPGILSVQIPEIYKNKNYEEPVYEISTSSLSDTLPVYNDSVQ